MKSVFDLVKRFESPYPLLAWYLLANYLFSTIIALGYLFTVPPPINPLDWVYACIIMLGNFAMLYLIIALIQTLLTCTINKAEIFLPIIIFMYWLFNVIVFLDFSIYKLFRFHFNSLIWNLITTTGASDSVKFGTGTVVSFILIALVILLIEGSLFFIFSYFRKSQFRNIIPSISLKHLLVVFILINVIDKSVYAIGDLYNIRGITRYSKVFPLYQPLTIKKYAQKHWGFKVNREDQITIHSGSHMLNYPQTSLKFNTGSSKPNFVVIVIDAWRYDMMTKEVTPNIYEFSRSAVNFTNHYSGGNSTRFGIFTLFYGLHGTYWHTILSEKIEPVMVQALRENGYAFNIISSTQLTFPEFRKTVFVGIPDFINDSISGKEAKVRDTQQPGIFSEWIDTIGVDQPFFAFFFLDAPHEPYSYPDAYKKFKPAADNINYLRLDKRKNVDLYRNNYKNAIYFDDAIVQNILEELNNRDLFENTVVIITSDHGAEFFERGFWGHNGAFSPEQVKVPLIMYVPENGYETRASYTSHVNIPSTITELAGCTTSSEQYSMGQSLLRQKDMAGTYVVASSWAECAMIDSENTIIFSTETYNAGKFEVRDSSYRIIADYDKIISNKLNELMAVAFSMGQFYK